MFREAMAEAHRPRVELAKPLRHLSTSTVHGSPATEDRRASAIRMSTSESTIEPTPGCRAQTARRTRARRAVAAALAVAVVLAPLPGAVHAQSVFSGSLPPAPNLPPPLPPVSSALPELGDSSQVDLSPAQERKLGEAVIHQARMRGAIMDDPEVNDYLNDLGQRLVAAVPDARMDFQFFAVNDKEINAFALPGGFVGVNTGLILLTQTESELASVLGHEISHVTQHHIARMIASQKDTMLMQLGALAVAILAAKAGGNSGGQAAQAAIASAQALSIQQQLNFTRAHEYEADRIGFQRMVAAGFDPNAMASFMKRMQDATRFSDSGAPSYLRSHPVTSDRIAEAQARAQSVPYRQVPDSLDFQMVRALLRSYEGDARDAVAYFDRALADHRYNNLTATQYGLAAALLRAQDFKRAKETVAALDKSGVQHPMIDAIAGHILMESGDLDGAIKRFKAALALYPNKHQLIYDYPQALMRAGRNAEAAEFAERELKRAPGDGQLHLIAARAYGALDKVMKQHQHQGEYYAWQGDLTGAVTQFELASKAKDGNFYDASVVDARLRDLRKELKDQPKENLKNQG
jgi:predicted Zn-dependent protease